MKVKKSTKKVAPPPPDAAKLIEELTNATDENLDQALASLRVWRYPRGDLHGWIGILDRFDDILANAITEYGLGQIQINDFTPKTKDLILEILRVEKILLENCTNRKLFASYDRLCDLLLTNDLDVLHSTLSLLLRPMQQYASLAPMDKPIAQKIQARLVVLARGSDTLRTHNFDLKTIASFEEIPRPEGINQLPISFYPTQIEKSPKLGPTTLTLDLQDASVSGIPDQVMAVAEANHMSAEDQFETLNKARWIASLPNVTDRHKLLACRLVAIAALWFFTTEDSSQFLYEPNLLGQMADLLAEGIDDFVQAGALLAFDASARHRTKSTELLNTLGANLSHGPLMSLLRRISHKLTSDQYVAHDTVDALFGLIGFISVTPSHSHVLTGAGIIPLLLDVCKTPYHRRDSYIPRATGLLDAFITSTNFAPLISQFVDITHSEVEFVLNTEKPSPAQTLLAETITLYTNAPLKALLRSMYRIMHSGIEGSRTLIDSKLTQSLNLIYKSPDTFGHKVYAQAISILASFVHNEPTSLTTLQEMSLPQNLFERLEISVPPSHEVLGVAISALGAACLNTAGLDWVKDHPNVIKRMMTTASKLVDEPGSEHIQHLGSHFDELARHHPALRDVIFDFASAALTEADEAVQNFVPTEEEQKYYEWDQVQKPTTIVQPVFERYTKVAKLWEGMLGSSAIGKRFITKNLDTLYQVSNSRHIPVNFSSTELRTTVSRILRLLINYDHVQTLEKLLNAIHGDVEKTHRFSKTSVDDKENHPVDRWIERFASTDSQIDTTPSWIALPGIAIKIGWLGEILNSMSWSNSRTNVSTLAFLARNRPGMAVIGDIAALHRYAFRAVARINRDAKSTSTSLGALSGLDDTADDWPKSGAQFLSMRIHIIITKFFKALIRLLWSKRAHDENYNRHATVLAEGIAKQLVKHLDAEPQTEDRAAIGLVTMLLFDERGPDGRVNFLLFSQFLKHGGVQALRESAERILDRIDNATTEERQTHYPAVRMAMITISALVSTSAITENNQVSAYTIDPYAMLSQLRIDLAPVVHRVWMSSWLLEAPVPIIKSSTKAMLAIMQGKGELAPENTMDPARGSASIVAELLGRANPAAEAVRPRVVADPARVNQLVDMGFGRGAAESALLRARNNVAAATDLLLSMPHLFNEDGPAEPEAENDGGDNPEAPNDAAEEAPAPEAEGDVVVVAEAPADVPAAAAPVDGEASEPIAAADDEQAIAIEPVAEAQAATEASASTMDLDQPLSDSEPSRPSIPESTLRGDDLRKELRRQLDELRAKYKDDILPRALAVLDKADDLVFDLLSAFPTGDEGLLKLLNHTLEAINSSGERSEAIINSRLRMLAIFMRSTPSLTFDAASQKLAVDIITPLQMDSPRPKWTVSLFVFGEVIFAAAETITASKIGDEPSEIMASTEVLDSVVPELAISLNLILSDPNATRDELISALRLLVTLSRRHEDLVPLQSLLEPFKKAEGKLSGVQPYVSMIFRHAFEDADSLTNAMRREIRSYLGRNKVTDVNHFVKQLRQVACRDPVLFIQSVEKECSLLDPTPSQSVYHLRALEEATKAVPTDVFQADDTSALAPVMDLLVAELDGLPDANAVYSGLIGSLITEIVGSYVAPKRMFIAALRKKSAKGGLATIVNDMICKVNLTDLTATHDTKNPTDSSRRIMLSSWLTSLLVALSAEPGAELKEDAEHLTTVRKSLLEVVAKSIKDTPSLDPNAYYGRLWALGELVQRLLNPPSTDKSADHSNIQIARIMLEKSFVSLLTAAAGEVDLNYPGVKLVLGSLLKALDQLTRISIKWSKSEKSTAKAKVEEDVDETDDSSIGEEDVDMDMDEDEQQAPDLYRNSALGMLDMMDEDSDMDDEGDEEDEEMMEAFEEELDAMDDEGSGTEPSTGDEGSEEDAEEWTDEEMDPDDIDEEDDEGMPQVIIGDPDPAAVEWNNDDDDDQDDPILPGGAMMDVGFGEGDEEEMWDGEGDDEDPDMDDMDEMDDMDDMDDMDEEEYDEVEMIDDPHSALMEPAEQPSHWGWNQTGDAASQQDRRPRGEHAASALFGLPSRHTALGLPAPPQFAGEGPAQPALLGPPQAPQIDRRDVATTRHELFTALEGMGGPQAVRLLESLLLRSERAGTDAVRISFAQGENGLLDVSVGGRSFTVPSSQRTVEPTAEDLIAGSVPRPSMDRWAEESRLTPIVTPEYFARLVQHLVNRLLPEAKKRAAEEEVKRKKAEEEKAVADEKKKAEEEAKEAEDAAKKAEEDAKKAEEDRQRAQEAETAAAVALPESRPSPAPPVLPETSATADESGDIEMAEAAPIAPVEAAPDQEDGPAEVVAPVEPAPAETLARTIVRIRGQDVDITDSGIDLEFLQALPEDMQADVIEQHLRETRPARRQAQADVPMDDDGISPEFLDALPPDIRREVLAQQEAERHQQRAPSAPPAAGGRPPMPNVAGFLATLDDELRDVIGMGGPSVRRVKRDAVVKPSIQRESVQLLEKPGIASLARLLFFPDTFKKERLFRVLANLCENSTSRSDLLNLLLSVLQDGSGDLPNVDRSFQQMSIKTLATPKSTPKAKAAESPAPFATTNLFAHLRTDNIPTFIAQRCLEALTHILSANSQAVNFFLTEHEQGVGLKKVPKKGKGKEKVLPQIKFPIVILLSLLDRSALLTAPGVMESLTALLATVTRPLSTLKADAEKAAKAETAKTEAIDGNTTAEEKNGEKKDEKKADVKDGAKEAAGSSKTEVPPAPRFPQIPNATLRLVVNCLTTGETTSRTFSQTLIVLQNLSCIPEAQKTILQELQERSQKLGQDIQTELHALTSALADPAFETGNPALMVFSSPSANQAQLLRLLKTIEYLHLNKVDSDPPGDVMTEKEQAVSTIYQSFDFGPMWTVLQKCLTQVEEREDTKQIALVILPLVESLMVICKYHRRPSREVRSPSAPPASAVEAGDLFLSFTTHHRKVLNEIVRNNPALLSGSFSLLIHNPRVLEFDNKRQWFFQKLKRKKDQPVPSASLSLNVRRQYVFQDSFDALRHRSGAEIKYGKIGVKFIHEDGIDAGGVTREWYSVLAQQIFDPNFALFEPCAADKQTYQPNKFSSFNGEHLAYFKFIGRIIGKAVYDGRLLDAYFNRAFYKQVLGRTVDIRDLESVDPEFHKSLKWTLENDITGIIDLEFTIEDDQFGEKKIVELKEGGASIPVTEENKEEYVRLVVSYRLENSIKDQVKAFLDGFYEVIPRKLIQIFEPDQLELLISGMSSIDVDELKNATQMSGWKTSDVEIGWFWRALRSFSQEERSRFLMFVTSSSRVPLGGFMQLQGSSGIQQFQIQKLYGKEGGLPQASTCFNLLLLPSYGSYEQLRERLLFAVTETGGFGKA